MPRAKRTFRTKDLFRHRALSGLTAAPDGSAVVWVAAQPDLEANENTSQVWCWTPDGGAAQVTFSGKASAPQFSPRGRRLAYLSDRGGKKPQVVVMDRRPSEGRTVTQFDEGVVSFTWSPDGRRLAVIAVADRTAEEKKRDEEKRDWRTIDTDERRRQLWIVRADGGAPVRVSQPGEHVSSVAWMPDGKRLAYVACPVASIDSQWFQSDLFTVTAAGRGRRRVCAMRGPTVESRMTVFPDGRTLLACGQHSERDQWHSVAVLIDLKTGRRRLAVPRTDLRQVNVQRLADGRILFESDVGTTFKLSIADARGNVRTLPTGDGAAAFAAPAEKAGQVFFIYSEPGLADEVYRLPLDGDGPAERLTEMNKPMASVRLAETEVVRWKSGKLDIEGLLYLPTKPGARKPYPLIVMPHGGPYGSSIAAYNGAAQPNVFCAAGYACLLPNFRGSTGRGRLFTRQIVGDWGDGPFGDIMAGVDLLIRRKTVDPRRLAIFGGSYGGYMTTWAVGHTNRFRCAVAMAAVTNNVSMWGTTDIPSFQVYSGGGRLPSFSDRFWCEQSPLYHVDKVRTPTLVVTGEVDARVPPSQSHEFYRALKARGVETRLVLYPREPHGINEPRHRVHYVELVLDWINEHMAGRK